MYKSGIKKTQNRSAILECIFRNAPVSRTEIADMTGITPATVTANVTELIADKIVYETGLDPSDSSGSGRKRIQIDLNPACCYVIGVEFTLNGLVVCLTNLHGKILSHEIRPFSEDLSENITDHILSSLHSFLDTLPVPQNLVCGIGIAVPGHINNAETEFISNNKIWSEFHPARIKNEFSIPVAIKNNVRCMTLGEYLFCPKRSPESFIYFHIGHGMFCSHLINGEVHLGNNFTSGEIGHTIVDISGSLCECGKHGCLQTCASISWLLKNARLLFENSPTTYLRSLALSAGDITIEHILTAYTMGDPVITNYIATAIKYLGITISNISIILGTQKIYLHSALFTNNTLQKELMDFVTQQLLFVDNTYHEAIEILPFDPTDGAVGACALAIYEFFLQIHPFTEFQM